MSRFVWPGGGAIARSDGVEAARGHSECVSDFSRRRAGFRGLQEARDGTAAALCKDTKTGLATTKFESYASDDGSPGRALDPINPRSAGSQKRQ